MNGAPFTLSLVGLAALASGVRRGSRAVATRWRDAPKILYHVTRKKAFRANPDHAPVEAVNLGARSRPGLFLTNNPDYWRSWHPGGGKKYIAIFDTSALSGGLWEERDEAGREVDFYIPRRGAYPEYFVKPFGFERLRLIEVLPYEDAKAKYSGRWGWRTE